MTARKPWPGWAAGEYAFILSGARTMIALARVALRHGLNNHRNVSLLKRILPLMAVEARSLQNACRRVQLQRRGERWPRWAIYALEETTALALDIQALAEKGQDQIDGNWGVVEACVQACLKYSQEIEYHMLSGPPPENPHSIVEQVEEVLLSIEP